MPQRLYRRGIWLSTGYEQCHIGYPGEEYDYEHGKINTLSHVLLQQIFMRIFIFIKAGQATVRFEFESHDAPP
jgi:hypothetical protein